MTEERTKGQGAGGRAGCSSAAAAAVEAEEEEEEEEQTVTGQLQPRLMTSKFGTGSWLLSLKNACVSQCVMGGLGPLGYKGPNQFVSKLGP